MKKLNILIACEESQAICKEFRKLGHNAFSCDILECSGGHPEWHINQDVLPLLSGNCRFTTAAGIDEQINGKWDLIMAHPPCTYLTVSGNGWFNVEKYGEKAIKRAKDREDAAAFFMAFVNADCDHIGIENPIGVMSSRYRKADQVIHPYFFGDPIRKATCLWLKNLPLIQKTNEVEPDITRTKDGKNSYSGPAFTAYGENGKSLRWSDPETARIRSKTYPGVAAAIATQWAEYLTKETPEE